VQPCTHPKLFAALTALWKCKLQVEFLKVFGTALWSPSCVKGSSSGLQAMRNGNSSDGCHSQSVVTPARQSSDARIHSWSPIHRVEAFTSFRFSRRKVSLGVALVTLLCPKQSPFYFSRILNPSGFVSEGAPPPGQCSAPSSRNPIHPTILSGSRPPNGKRLRWLLLRSATYRGAQLARLPPTGTARERSELLPLGNSLSI
jgi:hypothetical protein